MDHVKLSNSLLLLCALFVFSLSPDFLFAAETAASPPPFALLNTYRGVVQVITPAGAVDNLRVGLPLAAGDKVITGKASDAELYLPAGGLIAVGPESELV